jgi:hypothetical protein
VTRVGDGQCVAAERLMKVRCASRSRLVRCMMLSESARVKRVNTELNSRNKQNNDKTF